MEQLKIGTNDLT
jgi:hypothetical protein